MFQTDGPAQEKDLSPNVFVFTQINNPAYNRTVRVLHRNNPAYNRTRQTESLQNVEVEHYEEEGGGGTELPHDCGDHITDHQSTEVQQ